MRIRNFIFFLLLASAVCLLLVDSYYYSSWWPKQELMQGPYGRIGDIPEPDGFVRLEDEANGFGDYLRALPLAHPDSIVRDTEGKALDSIMPYCYRMIALPLINHHEQCADVCIRLRSEYLFHEHRYSDIHYDDTRYQTLAFSRGNRRKAFESYLKTVFLMANTESLIHETPSRSLADIRPGDVFVYDAKSRTKARYGHAIMVADVVVDTCTGKKMCMLVQGSTPACNIHILRNRRDSLASPWFSIDMNADTLDFGFAKYLPNELRYFEIGHKYADSLKNEVRETLAKALIAAYPEQHLSYEEGQICFPDGVKMTFDDGKYKDFVGRLDLADIEDMLALPYDTAGTPGYLSDAGRSRNDEFFKKMYGSSSSEVKKHLVEVEWYGQTLKMTEVNGVADQLRKVAEELAQYPELQPYLVNASTFDWREVRGAKRLSAHSFGIAVDINTEYSNYWHWTYPEASETKRIEYENRIPIEIVRIFERNGFVWGGRWYHYDTMHFEYRPEILSSSIEENC